MYTKMKYSVRDMLLWTRIEILYFLTVAASVAVAYHVMGLKWLQLPWTPVVLIGTAVAFLIGFQNNAAYGRAWEARKIWGGIVNESRTWATLTKDTVTNEYAANAVSEEELQTHRRSLVHRHIAWLIALRFAMRADRPWEVFTEHKTNKEWYEKICIPERDGDLNEELKRLLPDDEFERVTTKTNIAAAILAERPRHRDRPARNARRVEGSDPGSVSGSRWRANVIRILTQCAANPESSTAIGEPTDEGRSGVEELRNGEVIATAYIETPAEFNDAIGGGGGAQNRRSVCIEINDLPLHDQLLDLVGSGIADAALMLWPDWYGGRVELKSGTDTAMLARINQQLVSGAKLRVPEDWFRVASRKCLTGATPWDSRFSPTLQIRELAKCLADDDLCVHILLTSDLVHVDRLRSLGSAVEWVANETNAAVVLSLPSSLAGHTAFSRMRFVGAKADQDASPRVAPQKGLSNKHAPTRDDGATNFQPGLIERKHVLQPCIGRPHPASPGEQKLAEALERDEELRNLFQFNQRVTTIRENRPLVDLIWVEGKVVVEVDGYRYHYSRESFSRDRERDYELLISGYVVLRLPHDEVVGDVQLAVEKIRDVVRWRRQT